MSVAFTPGAVTVRGDLDIFLTNSQGNPANAAEITYAIYFVDPGPPEAEVLIGDAARTPINPAVGEYYASVTIPANATVGNYRIRWTLKELVSSPAQMVVQEFAVISTGSVVTPGYTTIESDLIKRVRTLLRDQHPDKFYRFRPPEHEGSIGQYNRIFGQIWEDAEIYMYLEYALDWLNMFPPATRIDTLDQLVNEQRKWRSALIMEAIARACFAVAANWVADEFDYSIGGVSLSIEKSSKYESLKQNAESQVERFAEAKARTVKFIRGLQQPRYGLGVRSAFGPQVGRGVLSPRNFVGGLAFCCFSARVIGMEVVTHANNLFTLWS